MPITKDSGALEWARHQEWSSNGTSISLASSKAKSDGACLDRQVIKNGGSIGVPMDVLSLASRAQ
jgi:hypothetical protein